MHEFAYIIDLQLMYNWIHIGHEIAVHLKYWHQIIRQLA